MPDKGQQDKDIRPCDCSADPFASLPPEQRPIQKSWKSGLRNVTCPGCGLVYWTSRESDFCSKCAAKGLNRQSKPYQGD